MPDAFIVLLDANVLVNAPIRDVLFRAAEYDLYQLALSDDIIIEDTPIFARTVRNSGLLG